MKISRILSLVMVAAAVTVAGQAAADNCKSPDVKVVNERTTTIKVTKIQYFDECDNKWRIENVKATEIEPGHSATFQDDLEYVGGCRISKFKLFRSTRNSTGGAYDAPIWGGEATPDEGSKVCQTNVKYTIHARM
jgi:hypothetical protein